MRAPLNVLGPEASVEPRAGDTATPIELVPDRLYAVGGSVAMDDRISWLSPDDRGFQAINGYVLKQGSSTLLIDTGVALHRARVLSQLEAVVDERSTPRILFTRAELDVTGNLVAIGARFGVEVVNAGGNVNPFDAFEEVGSVGRIAATFRVERVAAGTWLDVAGERKVQVIRAPLRMLNTCWAYDAQTKTLFTSDSFGHTFLDAPDASPVLTSAADTCDLAQLRRHTVARYWWLDHAVSPRLAESIEKFFGSYDVERIAPAHGCVLEGAELVRRHVGLLLEVLRGGGRERAA